ncbi:hypothetical protein [Cryptosporangium aurantiacum]|uniref:Uncharacterized protein n=1 Tax=Cryptosporangium aurantiacum TaxID=134849 RepID=A0A1M7REB4_9ACTN|nr:hypothetical protein [Cryptosporangium aurantiacum]SHN44521.1 hypothetical protein SAMN05443668_110241 [Cryptosporangium aurantiacum]
MTWRTSYRHVDLNPDQRPTGLWDAGRGPDAYFARQAAGVTALYTHLLGAATPVPANTTKIAVCAYVSDTPDSTPHFGEARRNGWESTSKAMDPAIPALPPDQRPAAYLAWLQPILLGLAATRGVPATGFEETFEACRSAGYLLKWDGPARSNPDRSLRAVPHYWFDADGDAWLRVTVSDRRRTVVAEGGPWPAHPSVQEWRFTAKALTWLTPIEVRAHAYRQPYASAWRVPASHTVVC